MTDYFNLLSEPRRPWLNPEALKQKFLNLSAEVHPDTFIRQLPRNNVLLKRVTPN